MNATKSNDRYPSKQRETGRPSCRWTDGCRGAPPAGARRAARSFATWGFVAAAVLAARADARPTGYPQDDRLIERMTAVGQQAVERAAARRKGLIDQAASAGATSGAEGRRVRIDATFSLPLSDYETDAETRVEFFRFAEAGSAARSCDALRSALAASAGQSAHAIADSAFRGETSFHGAYAPQTGGLAHRAVVRQGPWLIDVETVAWEPRQDEDRRLLAAAEAEITLELASTLFDAGVESGLIESPSGAMALSAPASEATDAAGGIANPNALRPADLAALEDLSSSGDEIGPEDAAQLTALITAILVADGMTIDAATTFAEAIVESLLESAEESREIERMIAEVTAELGADSGEQELRETVPWTDPRVLREGITGALDDTKKAARELADLAPIVLAAADETIRDVSAFHPSMFDWARIQSVAADLREAGVTLHEVLAALSQLAGDAVAANIDQDPGVLAALELLGLVSQLAANPETAAQGDSAARLQELLTTHREEVAAGLARIGQLTGRGAFEVARLAIGAQEWENALNGDLSPLTRLANALLAAAQTSGILHTAGTMTAERLAKWGDAAKDGARLIDEAGDAARAGGALAEGGTPPRSDWKFQTRRNPETGAIEWRSSADEAFRPLPEDVAAEMRNRPIAAGETRLNPDSGEIEWRNPKTGKVEPVPEKITVVDPQTGEIREVPVELQRPPYEQTPRPLATGRDAALRNLPEGAVIPEELLPQTGYAPHQLDELARIAKEEDVIFAGRTTNMDSLRHIAEGTATPKPAYIKSKTIQELDTYLGADPNDVGLVGYFRPKDPNWDAIPENLHATVLERQRMRLDEFNDLRSDIDALVREGKVLEKNGKLYRVLEEGDDLHRVLQNRDPLPFAGDIDPVYIRDAKSGNVLTGDRYLEVLEKFKRSGAEVQHGAEFNMSMDVLRTLPPGSPEYEKAVEKMYSLHAKLQAAHTRGAEVTVEMWPDGKLRRAAQLRWLGMEQ